MKKVINLLLIAALLVSMLSGCGASTDNADNQMGSEQKGEGSKKEEKLPEFEALDWSAVEEVSSGDFTYELIEHADPLDNTMVQQAILTSYTGDDEILNIPDKIDGYWIQRINKEVFQNNTTITHVRLPYYLNIAEGNWGNNISFGGCTSLQQVDMPLDAFEIPSGMFTGCSALREVRFNISENPAAPNRVGVAAFRGCTSLTSIVLPETVRILNDSAFEGCVNLESVEASGVTVLHDSVFLDCEKLETLKLNGQIDSDGFPGNNFKGCNSLKTVETVVKESDFSNNEDYAVLAVENGCLYEVNSSWGRILICVLGGYDTVELRDDITAIPQYAFSNGNIKEIVLPASVESIDSKAIRDCENLEKISLEKGSKLCLDDDTIIVNCPSLEVIDFSNAVEVSSPEFYDECPKLKDVLLPDGASNASENKETTEDEVVASLENALAPFQDRMKAAGFTYEIIMGHEKLSQVEIFTNKDELSAEDKELLKGICDAIAAAPGTGLDPDMKNQIANCDYSAFKQDFGGDYYVGSDKMALGYWENGGCLVFFTNN